MPRSLKQGIDTLEGAAFPLYDCLHKARWNPAMANTPTPRLQRERKDEFLAAIRVCRENRASSPLLDLLPFPEINESTLDYCFAGNQPVEVECLTRPKQGGGTRLELVLDFATSVRLQVLADRFAKKALPLPSSISAISFDPKYTHLPAYEIWREHISTWIRHRLVENNVVLIADIRNYFSSVDSFVIERVLRNVQLDAQDIEGTLGIISEIHCAKVKQPDTPLGIPISQDNLFWLIADLVLRSVDERLSRDPKVFGYIRWVDDFFIAIEPGLEDYALAALSQALEPLGLELNDEKTRNIESVDTFERYALTSEHRIVTSLMMTASHSTLSQSQQDAFKRLAESDRKHSLEHARLWKRVYFLATQLRSSLLGSEAFNDLNRYPTIENQLLTYLYAVDWPQDTAMQACSQIVRAPTDSQAIALLKALLLSTVTEQQADISILHDIAVSKRTLLHPYAEVLLHACLMFRFRGYRQEIAQRMLSLVADCPSLLARRTATEILWLNPETRHLASKSLSQDKGPGNYGRVVSSNGTNARHDVGEARKAQEALSTSVTGESLDAQLRSAFSELAARSNQ